MAGVLNCPAHNAFFRGSKPAEHGRRYGGVLYICERRANPLPFMKALPPVYYGQSFPQLNFGELHANDNIGQELLQRTTVFWEPALLTDKKGTATISFYTNDLPGVWECIVQGITAEGLIEERSSFTVTQ